MKYEELKTIEAPVQLLQRTSNEKAYFNVRILTYFFDATAEAEEEFSELSEFFLLVWTEIFN